MANVIYYLQKQASSKQRMKQSGYRRVDERREQFDRGKQCTHQPDDYTFVTGQQSKEEIRRKQKG